MKKYDNMPLPFERLKEYTKKYPRCWDWCDKFHNDNGNKGLPEWNKICEIPISATLSIMDLYNDVDAGIFPAELAGLYAWRKYKEIYSFDIDLAEMLMSQADDEMELPINVLMGLPYPCIYVQISKDNGFFTWFEDDIDTHIMELRFLYYENGKPQSFILHIKEGWTITDGITDMIETAKANAIDREIRENAEKHGIDMSRQLECLECSDEYIEWYKDSVCRMLQLILYICADNKEVEENREIVRRAKPTEKPKDVFREVRKWDVGYRIGNTIRNSKQYSSSGISTGTGKAKRPHARRGHWHHYWTGRKNEQKIILKWVAPMFINGGEDDIIPTQHNVK